MISKRDSKPFQIKFSVGIQKTNKVDMQYENDWHTCYGLVRDTVTGKNANYYGFESLYDKVITVNAGSITRMINYNTLIIVDNIPTSIYNGGDYSIKQIYPEYNGEIVIGLSKKEAVNIPKLYFESNGQILYYQLNFDKDTLKAYVLNKEYLPFKVGDYVWTREPSSSSVTEHRLKLTSISKVGFDKQFLPFNELIFVEE